MSNPTTSQVSNTSKNEDTLIGCLAIGAVILVVLLIFGCWFGWAWYRASVQASVYQREGIQMSTWECLMGAKPAERTINMKDQK